MAIDPEAARAFSIDVVRKLRDAGYEAFWAGGCVRDQLLGNRPEDYDVATNAQPEEVRDLFGRRRSLPIGASFGVITVVGPKPAGAVEVATFREDADYSDGRRPDRVRFCNAKHDAQRRDFTINGLFYDPLEDRTIDYVGGVDDLRRGVIRAIGDPHARIREDKLRMLRAVRFTATLDFELEETTRDAVRGHAAEIRIVSCERITQELRRMCGHENRVRALQLLRETELLANIFPELRQPLAADADSNPWWREAASAVEALHQPCLASVLAILLRTDHPPQAIASVGQRLRLSRDEIAVMKHLTEHESLIRNAGDHNWPRLQRVLIQPRVDTLLDYCQAVATSEGESLEGVYYCRRRIQQPAELFNPEPLIGGRDLMDLGVPRGPRFRELLDAVRDEQLQGKLQSKQEALDWLRATYDW